MWSGVKRGLKRAVNRAVTEGGCVYAPVEECISPARGRAGKRHLARSVDALSLHRLNDVVVRVTHAHARLADHARVVECSARRRMRDLEEYFIVECVRLERDHLRAVCKFASRTDPLSSPDSNHRLETMISDSSLQSSFDFLICAKCTRARDGTS